MECDFLIDFNSPQRGAVSMLDPLVPLPKVQTRDIPNNETVMTVGDNPFDNVFLQLCQEDDPFDIIEKKAQETSNDIFSKSKQDYQPCDAGIKYSKVTNKSANISLSLKTSPKLNKLSPNVHQATFNLEKSLSDSCLSPASRIIRSKYSKLYLSAQLDKQILDESSKCIDSGLQDISSQTNSAHDLSPRLNKVLMKNIPDKEEDIKAFIANRIEKCIEKAVTETRKSINSSFRHRRSLSVTSLHPTLGTSINSENVYSLSTDKLLGSFTPRNRSLSNHDISLNANLQKNSIGDFLSKLDSGKFVSSSISDRFNVAFRKSTATSSMYSSTGFLDTAFRKHTYELPVSRKSSSSFNLSLPQVEDDSVFYRNNINLNMKPTDCVFMDAKNLSVLLRRKAHSAGDEPLDCDSFLTDGKCDIELVDSDSSLSEGGETNVISELQPSDNQNQEGCTQPNSVKQNSPTENLAPLSRAKVAGLSLHSNGFQSKKTDSPVLTPPIPVPLNSGANIKELVLRPKANSESRVVARGPMKAVIPLGNMVRSHSENGNPGARKQSPGLNRPVTKSISSDNSIRKSVLKGNRGSENNKCVLASTKRLNSPSQPCGQPVACSTPTAENFSSRESPPVGLQVSCISASPAPDGGHRRSRSTDCQQGMEAEARLSATPTRNPARRIRSEDGRLKAKQKFPVLASPKNTPVFTSTPLKPIAKNSPPVNRVNRMSNVNRKLLHSTEKENLQPTRQMRMSRISSRTSRI